MGCRIGSQTESSDGFMNPSVRPAIDATIQPTIDATIRPAVEATVMPAVRSTVDGKVVRVVSTASAKQERRRYQWLFHSQPRAIRPPFSRAYDCTRRYAS